MAAGVIRNHSSHSSKMKTVTCGKYMFNKFSSSHNKQSLARWLPTAAGSTYSSSPGSCRTSATTGIWLPTIATAAASRWCLPAASVEGRTMDWISIPVKYFANAAMPNQPCVTSQFLREHEGIGIEHLRATSTAFVLINRIYIKALYDLKYKVHKSSLQLLSCKCSRHLLKIKTQH